MFSKTRHNLTVSAAKRLLDTNRTETVSTAKRLISIVAGAYIVQRGVRSINKHPITSLQETFLGIFLIYDAINGIKETYPKKPTEVSQIRKNQIQGNDPGSAAPAFV
jgi:hypothetical protein